MATNFGTIVAANGLLTGDNDMRLFNKGWAAFGQLLRPLVTLCGFVVAAIVTAPGGRLSGWELIR